MRARLSLGSKAAMPVLVFLLAGFIAPLLAVIWYSFMPPRTFSLAAAPSLENYETIFASTSYISFLWSLALAAATVVLLALICYPVAYGLVRVFGKWAMLLTLLFTIPLFVSENIRIYGWVLFLIKNGVMLGSLKTYFGLDLESILFTRTAILMGMVYVYLPFMLFPLTLGIGMVPNETRDAAFDLGATRWQVLREVTLPVLFPGLFSGALFAFLLSWGNFPLSLYTTGADTTVPEYLYARMVAGYTPGVPVLGTVSTIGAALLLVGGYALILTMRRASSGTAPMVLWAMSPRSIAWRRRCRRWPAAAAGWTCYAPMPASFPRRGWRR